MVGLLVLQWGFDLDGLVWVLTPCSWDFVV